MGIVLGDIVKRKKRSGLYDFSGNISAKWLFSDGYFIVIDIMISDVSEGNNSTRKETVCKIMDPAGQISWISMCYLSKV